MKITFSTSATLPTSPPEGAVFLRPSRDVWNDFGVSAIVDVIVVLEDRILFKSTTKAIDIGNPGQSLTEAANARLAQNRTDLDGLEFASAFQAIDSYRELFASLGNRRARKVLSLLRDAPYAKSKASAPGWLKKLERLPQLQEVLLRGAEAHFAFHNFQAVGRSQGEPLDLASESLDLRAKTDELRAHTLKFRWRAKSTVPRRFNVLVGANGTGKTHALHAVIRALVKGDVDVVATEDGKRPLLSRLIFIGTTGDRLTTRAPDPAIAYFRVSTPGNLSRRTAEVFASIIRSTTKIGGRRRAEIVLDALDTVFGSADLAITCPEGAWSLREAYTLYRRVPEQAGLRLIAELSNGRIIGRGGASLSSGHYQYIWMLMCVCANIENGSLVLIDEPERHLHPSLISQFVAIFNSILEWTGSFAILASHSAYFVREVPSDCVLVMRLSGDRVVVGNPSLQTFGSDIGAVSYFIFNDELIARMLADVAQVISVEGATDDYLKDVSISARIALERLI